MNCDYVKAVLYAYPSLQDVADAVGVSADNKALLSYRDLRGADEVAGDVVREISLRTVLSALRLLVEDFRAGCTAEQRYLLEYKYFRRESVLRADFPSSPLTCSERNYFRKQARLLREAALFFAARGWTREIFLDRTQGLFLRVLRAIGEGKEGTVRGYRRSGRPCQSSV